MADAKTLDVHKALADDTRFRLYRYLRLSGRPVSVRELATRLDLHPNTLRPHLRRLEDVGLVSRETERTSGVGRPQTMYTANEEEAGDPGDYRLLTEILCGLVRGKRSIDRAESLARDWGHYLISQDRPKPGADPAPRRTLAALQDAMARAGFDPRFRRGTSGRVEISLRDCPARELTEEHGDLVCALHKGLIQGMLEGVTPPLEMKAFAPLEERSLCRVSAR
jgi:predicted ArsR family transcriptional regulator